MIEIHESVAGPTIIKVIGVGGAGGNAVEHMIRRGVAGVEFICLNTDAQALAKSGAINKLQLGPGLGAGGKPERARDLALEKRSNIIDIIEGAHMVFITAGMGGGTGTGAAPIVAEVARELNVLTVAVVTMPFSNERRRVQTARAGLLELEQHVDSLIVVLNDKLRETLPPNTLFVDSFRKADDVLCNAVSGISEIINVPGLINVDFEDVRTILSETGPAMMGTGEASGPERAQEAAELAIASPLLEGVDLDGARGVLVNLTANSKFSMAEYDTVLECISAKSGDEANVIMGVVLDETMGDTMRVTVVAAGLSPAATNHVAAARSQLIAENRALESRAEPMRAVAGGRAQVAMQSPAALATGTSDFHSVFAPVRSSSRRNQVAAMEAKGVDKYDIPAYLREQAD